MRGYITAITELLLGAAHADEELVGHEVVEIRHIVSKMYGRQTLPPARSRQINTFDAEKFDVYEAAKKLLDLSEDQRVRVLQLIGMVVESDEKLELAENAYLIAAARALELDESVLEELGVAVPEALSDLVDDEE